MHPHEGTTAKKKALERSDKSRSEEYKEKKERSQRAKELNAQQQQQ